MTWEAVAALAVVLIALVAGLHVTLPYVRKRSDHETRLAALEAANVELRDSAARTTQALESMGARGLPRLGVSR